MKIGISALLVTLGATAVGIGLAAPANAGCETQPFAMYCDGPQAADGTWERCQTTFAQYTGNSYVPPTHRCYPVNPAEPWPMFPLGQPQRYIP